MPCACKGRKSAKYLWTSATDPNDQVVYNTEVEARAKVLRKGGTYVKQGT